MASAYGAPPGAGYGAGTGREMSVGSVLSRGFGAIGAAPLAFLGVGFVFHALPATLLGVVSRGMMAGVTPGPGGNPYAGMTAITAINVLPFLFAVILGWWILYLAAQAVLFRVAVKAIDGAHEPFAKSASAAARALPALFVLSIVLTVPAMIGMVLFFVPGIILMAIWAVAAPALVIERVGIFASLGRSSRLTRGARWRVFGIFALLIVMYYMAAGVVGVGQVAAVGMRPPATIGESPPIAITILTMALQTAFVAVWAAIQTALYVELRDWKDGPAGDRLAEIFA